MGTSCPNFKSICNNFAKIVQKSCEKLCKNFTKNCVKKLCNLQKGAWIFKFPQCQKEGIPKFVEIFEKNFQYAFFDVQSYILDEKN